MRCARGTSTTRRSKKYVDWIKAIKERDGKCLGCGTKERLHAHHILNFKDFPEKRFDLDNGMTLCCTCHIKLEKKGKPGHRKNSKHTEESKEKMRLENLGKVPVNKGIHKIEEPKRTCKTCLIEKDIDEFEKNRQLHRYECRVCRNKKKNQKYHMR